MKVKFLPVKKQLTALAALLVGFPAVLALVGMYVAPHDIKGVVYRDFDANGTRQNTATYAEPGVPGVTVTAYAADGTQAAQTTTGADGTYTLDIPAAGDYRVEFTGLQAGDFSGAFGTGSGTSVQFVSGGAENVNLGINYPAQYSSSKNPKIATSGFINGNQGNAAPYNNNAVVWTLPFNATGNLASSGRGNISTANRLGAIWGIAYAKRTRSLYAAAFTKRYVGFGPEGAGAIYKMDFNTDHTNISGNPTLFYKFDAAAVGTGLHGTLATTSDGDAADTEAFDKVGKSSLGDIDLSDDEKDLYVVTLGDRKLNRINVATASTPGSHVSFDIPIPARGSADAAYANDWRPFALKYYRGKVYVGVVTTNESSYQHSTYQSSGSAATAYNNDIGNNTGLKAEVFVFDPVTNTFSSTPVLSFPLTYTKQPTSADQTGKQEGTAWRPWTSTYRLDRGESLTTYSQAWLTDIEFDVNGDMVLGIRDRWGDQMGVENRRPASPVGPGGTTSVSSIAAGEVLRAGNNGNNTWTIENNGSVNGSTASSIQQEQNGPGGGKYYWGDRVGESGNHGSSSLGGLALLAGSGKLIMTAMDPTDVFNTGGIKRMINSNGFNNLRGNAGSAGAADDNLNNTSGNAPGTATGNGVYKGAYLFASGTAPYWGKANGMGEVELLTDPAPIEIGNRVWRDTDNDGIQDAGEPGIAGVTVELVDNTGAVVATAVTDANGNYIFSSDPTGTSTDALKYNVPLVFGAQYKVRVPNVSGGSKQTELGTDRLTQANQGESDPNGDTRDSDGAAVENETYAETALFTLGDAGENDHTHDFGFAPLGALGDYVWIDTDSDGIQDPDEEGVNGVTVTLYKLNPATSEYEPYGAPQQTRDNPNESGKKGYYWFDELPSGEYKVRFTDIPDNYKLTNADQGGDDAQDSDADSDGWSQAVTIDTSRPETDLLRINPTIDAGIVPVGALGDYVWFDNDSDGVQDGDEEGVNGVTVTLYKKNPLTDLFEPYGAPQTTGNNPDGSGKKGYYWFGDLPSGEYQVGFSNLPEGYGFTDPNRGSDNAADSDANPADGRSQTVTIDTSKPETDLLRINPTIDAGIIPVGSIGDYVWFDQDTDGEQDETEEGVNGVTVELYKWDETAEEFVLETTTVTAANAGKDGYYNFPNLRSGKYKVKFVKPAGRDFTHQDKSGADDADDSDADRTTGETGEIDIDTSLPVEDIGRNNPTIDAGLVTEGALPVRLVQFGAAKEGATAKLTWKTTSEVNASHFEVQRSGDAQTWVKIGTVAARGGENVAERYTFTDGSPVRGLNFYRLKTVDLDGTSEISRVVSVDFAKDVAEAAFVYPNPASESIRFSNNLDLNRVKSVSVTDLRGNVVYTAGSISADGIPAARFRDGLHIIRVRMDDGTTRDFKVVIAPKK
ncbi:MAG: hypothetical protein ABS46_03475 [Cytophagaceae bacterium SCN 52-12]|nr:MAG: hypothetical protein ABS46_03475 [Cytophagaceae bacterium SCN 52-12]